MCRLRFFLSTGNNVGKDADVGADGVFLRSCVFRSAPELPPLTKAEGAGHSENVTSGLFGWL